jgi:hypothetical protein
MTSLWTFSRQRGSPAPDRSTTTLATTTILDRQRSSLMKKGALEERLFYSAIDLIAQA